MPTHHEPIYKDVNGVVVPTEAALITGSNNYGQNPWALTVYRLRDTNELATWNELPDRHRFESCYCEPKCEFEPMNGWFERVWQVMPETAELNDTYTVIVYGVGDAYQHEYVWCGTCWVTVD